MSPTASDHYIQQKETITKLEDSIETLTHEIKELRLLISNHISSQTVRCENNTRTITAHAMAIMGDGDNRQGIGTRVSNLGLQVKLIMGVLSVVSTTTFGITIHLILRAAT